MSDVDCLFVYTMFRRIYYVCCTGEMLFIHITCYKLIQYNYYKWTFSLNYRELKIYPHIYLGCYYKTYHYKNHNPNSFDKGH